MSDVTSPAEANVSAATPPAGRANLVRNSSWNLLGQAVPALIGLAAMPIVVRELGPTRFGLLALAWTVVGYLTLFDLGFGRATIRRVSELMWSGQGGRIARVGETVALTQGVLGVLTGLLLLWGSGWLAGVLVASDAAAVREAAGVMRLLALAVPAVLVSNAYRSLLEGLQRFDLVNLARAPLSAATFLIPAVGALLGWSLLWIVAGLVLSRYAGVLAYGWLYARSRPAGDAGFDGAELRQLVRFGGWVAASNLIIPLVVYLERLVVSGVHGAEALAYYAAPHELVARLLFIPAAVAAASYPAFSGLSARGDAAELTRVLGRGTKLVALLMAPISAALILLATPLLTLWLGADYGVRSAIVLQLLAAAAFLNALVYIPFALVEGRGSPEVVTTYHLVELPLYAAVLWYAVHQFGIAGAAMAWGCRMLWTTPVFYLLALRRSELKPLAPLRGGTGRAVLIGAALLIVAAALSQADPRVAFIAGVLTLAAFAAAVWPLLLNHEDRAAARAIYRRLRSR